MVRGRGRELGLGAGTAGDCAVHRGPANVRALEVAAAVEVREELAAGRLGAELAAGGRVLALLLCDLLGVVVVIVADVRPARAGVDLLRLRLRRMVRGDLLVAVGARAGCSGARAVLKVRQEAVVRVARTRCNRTSPGLAHAAAG